MVGFCASADSIRWRFPTPKQTAAAAKFSTSSRPRVRSAPRHAFSVGVELHSLARARNVSRNLDGLHEGFRLAARPNLAADGPDFVGVRWDHRSWLHELIDHVGGLHGAGGEAVAHVHHGELRVVVVAHDPLLIRDDAGVAGEIGHETVAKPQDISSG